jgi:hypothetical protein
MDGDDGDDHVDGVRLRLWITANNGLIVHPPGDMSMENHGEMISTGIIPDSSTRTLCLLPTESSNSKAERTGEGNDQFGLAKCFCSCLQVNFFNITKSCYLGSTALLTLWRKACCEFLSFVITHRPRSGLSERTLGPTASTLTIVPSRRTVMDGRTFLI